MSHRSSILVLRKKEEMMTEIVNDQGPQAEDKDTRKIVFSDEAALAEYRASTKNKTLPAAVHPNMYADIVSWVRANWTDEHDAEAGRPGLKSGALTRLVRESVAQFIGYTGDLALTSSRTTNAQKDQRDAFLGTAATLFMFARMQAMSDPDGEAQAKANAIAVLRKRQQATAPLLVLTDEDYERMWAESTI
jgi:hypothetical protein